MSPAREKREPLRLCAACRQPREKRQLLRIVRSPEGELSLDFSGKAPGRGAYLCRDAACLKRAHKARSLERALNVKLSEELWLQLQQEIERESAADGQ